MIYVRKPIIAALNGAAGCGHGKFTNDASNYRPTAAAV